MKYVITIASLFLAVCAFTAAVNPASECECGEGLEPIDVSLLVDKFNLPADLKLPEVKEMAELSPASLNAIEDTNSFVYLTYMHEGVYYVRFGFEKGAWGPNGGRVLLKSGQTCLAGAAREFMEENAGAYSLSEKIIAENSVTILTKNHFGLAELLYFTPVTRIFSKKPVRANLATLKAARKLKPCRKEKAKPGKTCSYTTVTDHVFVAFADLYKAFYNQNANEKSPWFNIEAKAIANDQPAVVRTLVVDANNNIDVVEQVLNIRRNATPAHFRNVSYAENNNSLNGQEKLICEHANMAKEFFEFLAKQQ